MNEIDYNMNGNAQESKGHYRVIFTIYLDICICVRKKCKYQLRTRNVQREMGAML